MAYLQLNSRGDFVRDVQGLLWQAGLYQGSIDGVYGPKTEFAVKDWQSFIGAKEDGKWGAQTIKASANVLGEVNVNNSNLQKNMPIVPLPEKRKGSDG